MAVIGDAEGPMRACEVHRAVEKRLGETVSWSTVRNAVIEADRRPECAVRRVGYGVYEAIAGG